MAPKKNQARRPRTTKRKRQNLKEDSDDSDFEDEYDVEEEEEVVVSKKGTKDSHLLQQKSPAEFFADNKNIAGFDNVRAASVSCRRLCMNLTFCFCVAWEMSVHNDS